MIDIKNLTKIYDSKSKRSFTALKNINATLPSSGIIFVTGKSGSGKTTFLNLVGGLDSVTSGEINIDGTIISDLKNEGKLDEFRNGYMGFIFQDYYLINCMTVYENVKFALDLQNGADDKLIKDTLAKVGLASYETAFPKELSGGQQQRVAIARAIVKSPKLILADEPTGNLDEHTAKQIFELLKSLSKDCLVIVVSHDRESAKKYADRIIELSEGHIISDTESAAENGDSVIIDGDEISIPTNKALTKRELDIVNEKIKGGNVRLTQHTNNFKNTVQPTFEALTLPKHFCKSNLGVKNIASLTIKFTRIGLFNFICSTVIVAIMIVLFGLCQMLITMNANTIVKGLSDNEQDVFILQKGYAGSDIYQTMNADKLGVVTDEDLDAFKKGGCKSDMFLLYNDAAILVEDGYRLESGLPLSQGNLYKEFFATSTVGTLSCNVEYLTKTFGINGKLDYLGDLEARDYGLILTDYGADSLIYYGNGENYQDILNRSFFGRYYVNAIINTDYKQRYSALIGSFFAAVETNDIDKALEDIYASDIYARFIDEARTSLNMSYTVCKNYLAATAQNSDQTRNFTRLMNAKLFDERGNRLLDTGGRYHAYPDPNLKSGELLLAKDKFDAWFGDVEPSEKIIDIKYYKFDDVKQENVVFEKSFVIKGVFEASYESKLMYISKQEFELFRALDTFPYAILFDGAEDIDSLYSTGEKLMFYSSSPQEQTAHQIAGLLGTYKNLFVIFAISVLVVGLITLANFGKKNVKDRIYEIGLIRALGGRKAELNKVFLLQTLFIGIIICILSIAGLLGITALGNAVLSASLLKITKNIGFGSITFLVASPTVILIISAVAVAISVLAALVPLLMLNKIKPINIIKAKE